MINKVYNTSLLAFLKSIEKDVAKPKAVCKLGSENRVLFTLYM